MINIFILSLIGCFSLGMFSVGFQLSSINRIFISTPKEVFEKSCSLSTEGDYLLSFNDLLLKENLNAYYSNNLSHYVKEFSFNTQYIDSNEEFCFTSNCTKVIVNFSATIAFELKYKKSISYEIVRNNNG